MLLTALAVVVVGCQSGSTGPETSPTSTPPSGGKLSIVYIPKNTGNPYFDEVNRGFKDAVKDLNCDFVTLGPATADATSQIPTIKEQIQRGVSVICISPNSPDALVPVLDEARSKGITVITVDADLVGNETHRDAAVLPSDFSKIGSSQIELISKLIGGSGDIAILSATADSPNQNVWIEGMKKTLAEPAYKNVHLVDTVYGDDEPQKSTSECQALLTKHPGLAGIVSPTSVGLAAGAEVVERAGVYPGGAHATGKGLQITGLSTPNQLKKFVSKGEVAGFQLWSPYNEGVIAAHLGALIHQGKVKPAAGGSFTVPKLGDRKFSDKLEVTGGPLITFDKSNIAKFDF